jgi:rare lipoprotein A
MRRLSVLLLASLLVACGGALRPRSTGTITRSQRGTPAPVSAPSTPAEVERTLTPEPAIASAGTWWAPFEHAPATDSFDGAVSYYADSLAGNSTASGEPYDPRELTAASRTLPFGTVLRVTRPDTGRSVIVRVNDRGPFGRRTRVLDLSRSAAEALDMIRRGGADVHVEVVGHID